MTRDEWLEGIVCYMYWDLCQYEIESDWNYNPRNIAIYNFIHSIFSSIIASSEFYEIYDILLTEKTKYELFVADKADSKGRGYYGPRCFFYVKEYLEELMEIVESGDFLEMYYDEEDDCHKLYDAITKGVTC